MAGRGKAPKQPEQRHGAHVPQRGDWVAVPGIGWQHGPLPAPPPRLLLASRQTWDVWLTAWFAAHWGPQDLPMLRTIVRLFDRVERGNATAAERTELRQLGDSYGITPKGQQDRRWSPPKEESPAKAGPDAGGPSDPTGDEAPAEISRYRHLRSTG